MKTNPIVPLMCLAITAMCVTLNASAADAASTAEARTGIRTTLDKLTAILKARTTARDVAEVLYEEDLMIIGEGDKSLYRCRASFEKQLQALVDGGLQERRRQNSVGISERIPWLEGHK